MIYDNLESGISVVSQLDAMTGCDTMSYKINVGKVHIFKRISKDPSSLPLTKMLGMNIFD